VESALTTFTAVSRKMRGLNHDRVQKTDERTEDYVQQGKRSQKLRPENTAR
jgi:hypothetical protein